MVSLASATFHAADWAVLGAYFALLVVTGIAFSQREPEGSDEYFLAGRQMPAWAVAISVLATSLSAATFIGGPQQSYDGNLTYLSATIGSVLAVVFVALFFIPVYYRENVATVYELLERRLGPGTRLATSGMFMVGRVFASGARLYIVALPASLIVFGDTAAPNLVLAIAVMTVAAVGYTLVGGIRSIIWTDVIQTCVFVGAALAAAAVLLHRIPLDPAAITRELASSTAPDGSGKLALLRVGLGDWSAKYTLLTAVFGFTLLNLGAYGTDHDLAQRMLTCRSAARGSWSAIGGVLIGIPVTILFMLVGLLLYIFYRRPDLMGSAAPSAHPASSTEIFLTFILNEMPRGMAGVMMAGLFAAGLGSMNSALNAMSATLLNDFYRPRRPGKSPRHYLLVGRLGVAAWGLALGLFACACVWWYGRMAAEGQTLIDFALMVMAFAYSGLVGVFLTAIFTRRGNSTSAIAALATGFLVVLALQPAVRDHLADWPGDSPIARTAHALAALKLAFPWHLVIGTAAATAVCSLGRRIAYIPPSP
ncbi:MAG: sodium/solute symporter [Phycisphaeraceae bacterium]|nr:sodium/solute symporter [Phycisphaeraceae bacterium]